MALSENRAPVSRAEIVAREDLVTYLNAAFVCTAQGDYYASSQSQAVSIAFLHAYAAGNYRRLYARSLAVGINHFNQALCVETLLAMGAPTDRDARREEHALIAETLARLPPSRVYRLFEALAAQRVNNRRTRATVAAWLGARPDLSLDALKYRPKLSRAVRHTHTLFAGELGVFLFQRRRKVAFETPLFAAWRRAQTEREAVFSLPFSVAEGFAQRHGIARETLVARMQSQMTRAERARTLGLTNRADEAPVSPAALGAMGLTRLARALVAQEPARLRDESALWSSALAAAAARQWQHARFALPRVAVVIDRSASANGGAAHTRGPLALALAVEALIAVAATACTRFVTPEPAAPGPEGAWSAAGRSDLATPLIAALAVVPPVDMVVIVSDGYENDPPGGAAEVMRVFRAKIDPTRPLSVVHVNPAFDSASYGPRRLGDGIVTVGLREAEDLPTVLGFVRFAEGSGSLDALEAYLAERVRRYLERGPRPEDEAV